MKKRFIYSATAVLLSSAIMLGGCSGTSDGEDSTTSDSSAEGIDSDVSTDPDNINEIAEDESLTSIDVIRLMGNGINLGNTLEAYNHQGYLNGIDPGFMEMGWGQPYTTAEMVQSMKDAGFDTLRIPVAWTNGMNYETGDYTIDERLLKRVAEVVNYALDAGMYVIVNDHWDGGWWGMFGSADEEVRESAMEMYKSMWTQIGNYFKDYSYRLIFESANEELGDRLNDSDVTGSKGVLTVNECYETTNLINSEFVSVIRSLGGKNENRFLLIAGYNTDITMTCDDRFKMPEDTAENKLLLSVHYYTPWDYCGTSAVNQWGSPTDYDQQNELFEKLSKFSDQGYGVVIGEYAVLADGGSIKPDTEKFYSNLLYNCDLYDYCPVLWDCSDFYKRSSNTFSDEGLVTLFDSRRYENESTYSTEEIKATAKEKLEEARSEAESELMEGVELPPSDDMAIAWIMFQSADYSFAYSVGDTYDPTNRTVGIVANNAEITGEGTYTVSLDFSQCGTVRGTAFAALGISNGEIFFPNYIININSIEINGEVIELSGKPYTSSDDNKCTRVNLYNAWVSSIPDDARTADGDLTGCSAQIMQLNNTVIETLSITFTYQAGE